MARIHGNRGQVLMDPTGASSFVVVANVDSWDLDMDRDTVDVTAFGDTNKQSVLGLPNYTGALTAFYSGPTAGILIDAAMGTVAVNLKLVPDLVDIATNFFAGLAYLSASIKVSAKGAVTVGGKFVAAGNWVATLP
jgi:hypothetical protein